MDEIYKMIENKIADSGYRGPINGSDIYSEISDFIEEKENGTYLFMSKNEDDALFEYKIDVMTDNFNLSYIKITEGESNYFIDFDH